MINSIDQYLAMLKEELTGSDRATIQDALSDAEEYLRTALSTSSGGTAGQLTLEAVIEDYGMPEEVAAAYKQIESNNTPAFAERPANDSQTATPRQPAITDQRPFLVRFFGIFAEPGAWGAVLYLMLALITGIFYFTWVVTGFSLSAGLLVLVIGLPIAGLFLLSVRGLALVEGRLVEALLGVRMPRRARYTVKDVSLWQRFKNMLGDKHTWFSMIYMMLQLPLGIFYFSVLVTLISLSVSLILWPIVALTAGWPVLTIASSEYYATGWLIPITIIIGGLLLTATMHLARVLGKGHGSIAKALLVRL
jgi:uncharacterized membrane protein